MLFQTLLHVDHVLFALLIWISLTHMLSGSFDGFPFTYEYDEDDDSQPDFDTPDKRFTVDLAPLTSEEEAVEVRGLYAILKQNPSLMDRRLQVGSEKPQIPSEHTLERALGHTSVKRGEIHHRHDKRSFSYLNAVPVCSSSTQWRMLHVANDVNGREVQVFQPLGDTVGRQWFYITTCNFEQTERSSTNCTRCCRGININMYYSRCSPRKSFVMALVKQPHEEQYDWNWIQIDTSCSCSISPL
ncbi:neurotrophin-4-like [Pomacea canaliculata]|uniref:neurotrophin-4-like n=1 Tax=Pomacea canaliculata TaxID=400727 RepID=UPI000D730A63|nr:neurotrophin-4-like [Pomacea canaliculata]